MDAWRYFNPPRYAIRYWKGVTNAILTRGLHLYFGIAVPAPVHIKGCRNGMVATALPDFCDGSNKADIFYANSSVQRKSGDKSSFLIPAIDRKLQVAAIGNAKCSFIRVVTETKRVRDRVRMRAGAWVTCDQAAGKQLGIEVLGQASNKICAGRDPKLLDYGTFSFHENRLPIDLTAKFRNEFQSDHL